MAERLVVVCDVCGKQATEVVGIRVGGRALRKDLCATHLAELTDGARAARRGRPKSSLTKAARPTGRRKSSATRSKAKSTRRRRRAATRSA
jgi:hypothetical protein